MQSRHTCVDFIFLKRLTIISQPLYKTKKTHIHTHAHSHTQQNNFMGSSQLQMSRFVNIKQINSFEVDSMHTRRFTPPLFSLSSFSTSYLLYTSLHTLTLTHTLTHTHSHTTNNNTLSPLPTHTLTHTHTHIHTHNHIQHLHFLLKSTHLGRLDFSKSSRLY